MDFGAELDDILLLAINSGREEMALMLAKKMEDHMITSSHLEEAASAGHHLLVSFLLDKKGSVLFAETKNYCDAVCGSALGSHVATFSVLMGYAEPAIWRDLEEKGSLSLDAIHSAIRSMDGRESGVRAQILSILLLSGFQPERMTNIITHWIKTGYVDCVRVLLADGRAHPSSGGHSSICEAARTKNVEMLRLILEDGREDLTACIKGRRCPFLLTEVQENIGLYDLLLSHLAIDIDPMALARVLTCAIRSRNPDMVKVFLKHVPNVDLGSNTLSFILEVLHGPLVDDDAIGAMMLRLVITSMTLDTDTLSSLLRVSFVRGAHECFLVILDLGGPLLDCNATFGCALLADNVKMVQVLLDDERVTPSTLYDSMVGDLLSKGVTASLGLFLRDKRVNKELPITESVLLLLCAEGDTEDELVNEYLEKAVENLKAGIIGLDKRLSRLQLKDLARRMGYSIHAGLGKGDLISLICPK